MKAPKYSPDIHIPHFLSLLSLLSLFSLSKSTDLQILLQLKSTLQNPNTHVFDSWLPQNSITNFTGITTNPSGFVTEIELSDQNLFGSVAIDSICKLQYLEKLSLGVNSLSGTVSPELNNCVRLKYLDLGNNLFSGEVPEISALRDLEFLYLNNSGFSGVFPWKSLANMTGLVSLSVGDNLFSKKPFPTEIVKLLSLNWLYLSNCSIEGAIPTEIGNLTELTNLELSMNYLTGTIPNEIGKLKKLKQLELYENELVGKIPIGFGNLSNLKNFDASTNYLEGDLSELRFLKNLVSLQLFENGFTGNIPVEFGGFERLVNLSLYTNMLTGSLPEKLGSWADFDFIDVSENMLSGSIPSEMCKNGKMKELLILQNRFTGEIPASYGNCTTLTRFRVSNNSLSGTVPAGIWGLPNVNIIDIAINEFEGPISGDIGNAKALGQLFAANNRFSGVLPSEISGASSLVSIDLSFNRFSGHIPATIGDLKGLSSLYLQNNMFSGSIPSNLRTCKSLSDINMAENSLSGQIPSSLGSLPTLNFLNLSVNQLSGEIPMSFSSLKLSLLDLSYNQLIGRIPQSLSIEAYNGSFAGNSGLCSNNIQFFRPCTSDPGSFIDLRKFIICFVSVLLLILVSFVFFIHSKHAQKNRKRSLKDDPWDAKSFHVLTFTEEQILDSIKQENLIGKGGSGSVYRVSVSNGKELAVKLIWNTNSGDRRISHTASPILKKSTTKSSEFDAEVETLSSIRHVNVVKLYCSITSEDWKLLVYEYFPNGSLWDLLHTCHKMELDWVTRYEIAVGSAKGLEYLHHGCEKPVIHRDVKSSNILLDEFLKPRIADFGLAKIVESDSSKDSTHVVAGTHGYIAPEYGYTCKVNEKSDVYSFGVVLMELVTGKRPIEPEYGDNKDIVSWVYSKIKTRDTILSVVDSSIPISLREEAIKVLRIAFLCTTRLPVLRPTMREVVQMLVDAEPCKLVEVVVGKEGSLGEEAKEGSFAEEVMSSVKVAPSP